MNQITAERVDKAEDGFSTDRWEICARKNPNYDAACFHDQQWQGNHVREEICKMLD